MGFKINIFSSPGLDNIKEKANPVYASAKNYVDSLKKSTTKKQAAVPREMSMRTTTECFLGTGKF